MKQSIDTILDNVSDYTKKGEKVISKVNKTMDKLREANNQLYSDDEFVNSEDEKKPVKTASNKGLVVIFLVIVFLFLN